MAAGDTLQGRDVTGKSVELQPGDYWYGGDGRWYCMLPTGICSSFRESIHTVARHDDGTISVTPSLLFEVPGSPKYSYHGYLTRSVWHEV